MVITDQDIREFRERAKIELKSGHDCGRMRWDDIVEALCKEVERIRHESSGSLGNTTAMREALEYAARILAKWRQDAPFSAWNEYGEAIDKCRAALAAPPRNCDKFDTKDKAREAFQKLRGHCVWADVSLWDNRDEIEAFLDWLFATKKGK